MAGRCAGCAYTDSTRKVAAHLLTCERYIALYHADPARALDPDAEYRRHRAAESSIAARTGRRDARLRSRYRQIAVQYAQQTDRWKTPADILDD